MDCKTNVRTTIRSLYQKNRRVFGGLYLYCLILYLPLIVLRLTNCMDGMWDQDDHVAGAAELRIGRWFWPYLDKLRLNISLDPLPAIVSLALFVLGFLLVLEALQLRRSWITCGAGVLFLSSPAVLCQLSYSYMSITFSTGFLLAVLAVWVPVVWVPAAWTSAEGVRTSAAGASAEPGRRLRRAFDPGILISALLIAVMMGCYQAFLGVTCVLALFVFLLSVKRQRTLRPGFVFVLRMLIALALGAVLYELLLQANLTYYGETMSDYNGADSITFSGVLGNLPASIRHTYVSFRYYYGTSGSRFHALQGHRLFPVFYVVPILGAVLLVVQTTAAELKGSSEKGRCFHAAVRGGLMLLALAVLPVFANSFFLLAVSAETQMQMTGGMALSLPLVLCLWEEVLHADGAKASGSGCICREVNREISNKETSLQESRQGVSRLLRLLCAAGTAALIYGSAGQAATDEYAMYVGRQATTTLARNVLNQFINSGTDYTEQVVMVYGQPAQSPLFVHTELYDKANYYAQYGSWASGTGANRLCWFHFFGTQLRVNVNYALDDTLETIYHSPEVAAMPVYPAAGSTANVWGVTVVKISE